MLRHSLSAGVARTDITPPLGFRMQGAMRRTEGASGVQAPLLATCLVLADDEKKLALVDCDLIGFDVPLANEIRRRIGGGIGAPAANVILGCTHTHNGPCTFRGALGGVHDVGGEAWEISRAGCLHRQPRAPVGGHCEARRRVAASGPRPRGRRAGAGGHQPGRGGLERTDLRRAQPARTERSLGTGSPYRRSARRMRSQC